MRLFDASILYWNSHQDAYSKAECYREGRLVKQSMPRALVLYRQAAQQGDARAYFRLGQDYQTKNQWKEAFAVFYQAGVKNHQETLQLLENLAKKNIDAVFLLAKIYEYLKQYTQAILFYNTENSAYWSRQNQAIQSKKNQLKK